MNRKQRRAAKGAGVSPAAPDASALFAAAVRSHQDGRLADAEILYSRVLALDPGRADVLHRLGVIAYQVGQASVAIDFLDRAVAADSRVAAYHVHRGLALAAAGRLDEASDACATAVELSPDSVEGQVNLGLILLQSGRFEAAAQAGRHAVALAPALADGHTILGEALLGLGRTEDAIASHRRAVDLAPDDAEARNGLGQALWRLGRLDEAGLHFRQAIAAAPAFVLGYGNLAGVLKTQGRLDEAAATLRHAAALSPGHPAVLNNLALVLMAQRDGQGAMETLLHALAVNETPALRQTFVHCLQTLELDTGGDVLRPLLMRALREGWGRPEDLVRTVLAVVKQDGGLAAADDGALGPVAGDALLQLLMTSTPIADFEVERVLARARGALLRRAEASAPLSPDEIAFYAALAQQAFINEYVYGLDSGEADRAARLGERLSGALEAGEAAPAAWLLATACYGPLSSIPFVERLSAQSWPAPIEDVLRTQIVEPAQEAQLRAEIPQLTAIFDSSLSVQAQYEENPYPRWIRTAVAGPPQTLSEHLLDAYPQADLAPIAGGEIEVLIAGCGTGRNALETHGALAGARTLAIDLSTASLAYALRKTRERSETRIQYAQADLLNLAATQRSFDFIEAAGVLHHLADPLAGWRALLSVLRAGGVMRLGFYSALARRNLPELELAEPTPDGLRQARQSLAARDDPMARQALLAQDFYSLSACRDLLFHTREHRLSLGDLAAFMHAAGLRFIGFVIDDQVLAAYQRRYPHDPGGRDLKAWAAFEQDHPDTFAKMYQFWVQKV